MVSLNVPRREGLFNIDVNEEVEFVLSYYNFNNYGKKQFSGFVDGKFYYLPAHQQLVNKLENIPRGSHVKAKRLTAGHAKKPADYDVEVVSGPTGVTIKEEPVVDTSAILNTVVSCLKNNCSSSQIIMVLRKEYDEEDLKEIGL